MLELTTLMSVFETFYYSTIKATVDISPDYIDVEKRIFCFSPETFPTITSKGFASLQTFLAYFRINHLALTKCSFSHQGINMLCDLIRVSHSLTSVDLSGCKFSKDLFSSLLDVLQSSISITNVYLCDYSIILNTLLKVFEFVSTSKYRRNIQISPHFIDFSLGTISYENHLESSDLSSLLINLKSKVPVRRVEVSTGCKSLCLLDLITVFEILSINYSALAVDISPHIIDVDNAIFCFAPETSSAVTTTEVSSLQSLFDRLNIKVLSLKGCCFSDQVLPVLCDSIKYNNSLTSIDFSNCQFSADIVLRTIVSLDPSSCLTNVNLSYLVLELKSILTIFQLVLSGKLLPNIQISPHLIDFSLGTVRYEDMLNASDVCSLLKNLKSSTPIKHVECRGIKKSDDICTLVQVFCLPKSVIDLDLLPHRADAENGVLCFSPRESVSLTSEEVLFMHSSLKGFDMNELSLLRCNFSHTKINTLCDFVRLFPSLTFVAFK
ncbi:hypothetical protein GEMRC1_010112 [Eukaryota sp. GEM-RC1]